MKNYRILLGATALVAATAMPLMAQEAPNVFELEPYAGAFSDAYDISPDGEKIGGLVGLRVGYPLSARTRAIADIAYASTRDVSNPNGLANHWVYDNTWAITTIGAEYDALTGRTSASLGLQVGAGWRRNDLAGSVGNPDPASEVYSGGFSPMDVIVPGVTVRRQVTRSADLVLRVQDQMFDLLEGPVNHSPSVTMGVLLR